MTYSKPIVGSKIIVTTDWNSYYKGFAANVERISIKSGVVVKSEKFDDPASFRLATGNPMYPISVIHLDRVVEIVYNDRTKAAQETRIIVPQVQVFEIKSSSRKGGSYTVTFDGKHYDCNCVGFQYRKNCRHVNEAKERMSA